MDWIDPRYAEEIKADSEELAVGVAGKAGKSRRTNLVSRTRAALAQPMDVWSAAYDHALGKVSWPKNVTAESTLLWSCVLMEQAEILVRAGMSATQISELASSPSSFASVASGERCDSNVPAAVTSDVRRESVSGLMSWPIEGIAQQWLDDAERQADAAFGLSALLWMLPEHARRSGNTWLGPWLQDSAERVAKCKCDPDDSVLCELVLKCELPLLLGTVTGAGKRTLFVEAFEAMDHLAFLLEQADDLPARWLAYGSSYLRAALGSVLRSRVLADALGLRKFYVPQRTSLARLLEHAARWSRSGGSSLLGFAGTPPTASAHWDALAKLARKSKPLTAVMALSELSSSPMKRKEAKALVTPTKLPPLTNYCDTARVACMQTDWLKRGGRVAIDFSDSPLSVEVIGPKGAILLAGHWTAQVEWNGQAQLQLDDWEEVCWYSDEEVDYLEVEARFGDNCCIQRQIMLFRSEGLVMLADALLGDCDGKWSVQSTLPLGSGVTIDAATATRESWLVTPRNDRCLVLPLALPEWRKQLGSGRLMLDNQTLTLRSTTEARRLYSPVLISVKPAHSDRPLTWRQLTVAENLEIVPASVAAAYRIQIGSEQWIIYRTLAEATRRTALGMHTIYDFYAGRFDGETGDVDTLVEVEAT